MRTLAVITVLVLVAVFAAPIIVSAGSKLARQAKQYWKSR